MTQASTGLEKAPRVDILGVRVSATTMEGALAVIEGWIARGQPHYVCVSGMHGVMECQRDEELRQIHNAAGLVTTDGMPLVWLCRLKGQRSTERVYGPDLMLALCSRSHDKGYRHFLYGASEDVLRALTSRLRTRFPWLNVVGTYAPPYRPLDPVEDSQIVESIKQTRPDVVWVGLSTPKQERWMAEHVDLIGAPALIGVGAAFDFHSGRKRQAPRWMQRTGLEWFFRLLSEPRRLYRRYLLNIPLFAWYLGLDAVGFRNRSAERGRRAR